jgi:hypothetical protein
MATNGISTPTVPEDDSSITSLASEGFRRALAGDDEGAMRRYAAALRQRVGRGVPAFMHLSVLRARGMHDIAGRLERLALDFGADISFAGIKAQPDLTRAMAEYEGFLAEGRINARMVARYAQIASLAGDAATLARLMDPTALLRIVRLGLDHLLADAVADYLTSEAVRPTWHETFRSTRQLHHLPHVDQIDAPPLRRLFAAIHAEIEAYLRAVDAIDHPFFRWRPADPAFGAWALQSDGSGYNVPHIHPQGWLTGVYYAAWRHPDGAEPVIDEGALYIGPDPQGDIECPGWARSTIAPEPGTLVIMPSYYMHHTLPARRGSLRISIPFDVLDRRSFLTAAALSEERPLSGASDKGSS